MASINYASCMSLAPYLQLHYVCTTCVTSYRYIVDVRSYYYKSVNIIICVQQLLCSVYVSTAL